jgi:uncharacterized cupredoxin-like copper-binding protein
MRALSFASAVLIVLGTGAASSHDEAAPLMLCRGGEGDAGTPVVLAGNARTIRIDMSDRMRFSPEALTVKRGETVRLVAANGGRVLHELVIGTRAELEQHAALMRLAPQWHDELSSGSAHVPPGGEGELAWRFTRSGEFYFACLVPGHLEAGMIGTITVTP